MKCKYCQAELTSNSSVCPKCGKDNLKDQLLPLKVVALSLTCLVMLVLLVALVYYGVTGSFPALSQKATESTAGTSGETDGTTETTYEVLTSDGTVTMTADEMNAAMDTVIATVGDSELTNREFQIRYWMAVYAYMDDYDSELDYTGDLSAIIFDEESGQSVQDYCIQSALDSWQEQILLCNAAADAGFEMPTYASDDVEEMVDYLEYYVYIYTLYGYTVTLDDMIQMQFGMGTDYDTYYDYMWNYYLGDSYWYEMAQTLAVSDAEIRDWYAENADTLLEDYGIDEDFGDLVDFRNILILVGTTEVTDDEGNTSQVTTEDNWAECLQAAQELYDTWIANGGDEAAFIALIAENSDDDYSIDYDGLYEDQYKNCLAEVDVRHILIFPEGATSSTVTSQEWSDEAWQYAADLAQTVLDTYLAGDLTAEAFGALAEEYSEDTGSNTNGGLYEDVYVGQMVDEFNDWCFDDSRQEGDVGIIKTAYGYHVMYFVRADKEADTWMFDESRQVGDVTFVKTDDGYQLLYYVGAEPAWYRYSRYCIQTAQAADLLEELVAENPITADLSKIALVSVS